MVLLVLNFALCIPVLLLVGGFSLYHFYCAMCNTTTIEGWEKDRVATMVRRGRVRDVSVCGAARCSSSAYTAFAHRFNTRTT